MISFKDIKLISRETYKYQAVCHNNIIYLQYPLTSNKLKQKGNQKASKNIKLATKINQPSKLINKIWRDQIKIQPKVCITNQKKRGIEMLNLEG